ncbi:hypothetical protein [Rathayibacter toxicus]|uniref:hypothetical protein n=1 Tax=Rathayibacter toxicus TaxID=145458 RepID=UPI000CE807B3|nr:hypothetical protein [Rathayibacter toxicus]PPI55356.1 hypothetical protein C5D35_06585 [Rathayibacter toxicus]QOD11312.1 hypothetical protein BSG36_05075 [Rathayibacter toxicus]QWL28054.1 hypothetical protein E2R33_05080 [Rathayibacter toxicus]QWL32253.1 hypothetical protein E2R35_04945 [Rathayibacter toxicus]QWL34346.1 hypothetical protein E2R36_04945 [Rathayibacter toxicus]
MRDAGGLRLGTAWLASCGYTADDVTRLGHIVVDLLDDQIEPVRAAALVHGLANESRSDDVRVMYSSRQVRA